MNTVLILLLSLFALTTILALAPVLWLIVCDFRNHRAIHRLGDGLPIAWRRRADGVLMQQNQVSNMKQELFSTNYVGKPSPAYMVERLDIRMARQPSLFCDGRLIVWFSCGAASACALKLTAHLNPLAVYCNLGKDEHADNVRFRADVERWTGIPVTVISSTKYTSIEEVWEDRQFMSGPKGAPCTVEMKKVPRFEFQRADDVHLFGMTSDETDRIANFENDNIDMNLAWPLVQAGMTKADCIQCVFDAGIAIPTMYRLGFKNNNCIGCVKATSVRYWNMIRRFFPDVFQRRAEQSRRIGCRLVKYKGQRIFLDELPLNTDDGVEENVSCGPQCGIALVA